MGNKQELQIQGLGINAAIAAIDNTLISEYDFISWQKQNFHQYNQSHQIL